MLTITRNEARRQYRRRRDVPVPDSPMMVDTAASEAVEQVAVRMAVRGAVENLSVREQALVRLRYNADMTQAELARLLDIPEGTVKVQLHRARARLRQRLEADR